MTDTPRELAITAGAPTPAETAAIGVVLGGMLEELAVDNGQDCRPRPTAWRLAQRPIRRPIMRGYDRWQGFSG